MSLQANKNVILLSNITASTVSTPVFVSGYGFVVAQVSTMTSANGGGSLYWQGSHDLSNWYGVRLTDMQTGTASTASTGSSIFQGDIRGVSWFRANVTSVQTGMATITVVARFESQK